jgi:hypothetical protein
MAQSVSVVHWNANSIAHKHELQKCLYDNKIDIFCLQETFLKPRHQYNLTGYTVERKDRLQGNKGGVALGIKNGIHYVVNDIKTSLEAICVTIYFKNKVIDVTSIYIPPDLKISREDLSPFLKNINALILGDFNAHHGKWGSYHNNFNGKTIASFLESCNAYVLKNGQPTYIDHLGPNS